MSTIKITPSAATKYYGSSTTSDGNYLIGRSGVGSTSSVYSMRYTFKPGKKLKKIIVKINGKLNGTRDGNFRYSLSTASGFPSSWTKVTEEGSNYLSIAVEKELAANTTYYLFVSKSTAGNYVYYSGCSADNVEITGETAGAGHAYRNGAWRDAEPKVYKNGAWQDAEPKVYKNGLWQDPT